MKPRCSKFIPVLCVLLLAVWATEPKAAGQAPLCDPPGGGLVGWWPAEGNTADLQGTNAATLQGNVTFAPGKAGQAFSFDGATGAVLVPDSPELALEEAATMMAWVKLRQLPSTAGHLMHVVGKSQNGNDLDLQVEGDNRVHFYVGPGLSVASPTTLQSGLWYFMAALYRTNQIQLYVDGVLEAGAEIHYIRGPNSNPLTIGWNYVFPGRYFDGEIDEVAVYDRALSPSELAAYFVKATSGACKPLALVIYPAVEIGWLSQTNKQYQAQWASELDLNTWFDLSPPVSGSGSTNFLFDSTRSGPKRFYRVLALP
jgi:hypothetical protein